MEHLGWLHPKCQKGWNRLSKDQKKKLTTANGSLHLHLMFVTQLLVQIQSYRLNLVGLIHEKTKCVLYCNMKSTKTENKSYSWFQSCMDSIQELFYGPVRSNNARQNQLSCRFCSGYHIYRSIISQFGFQTSGAKPFYFKDITTRGQLGFHSRNDRNHSDLYYDTCGCRTYNYVEVTFFAIGFSSEQLVCNVAG